MRQPILRFLILVPAVLAGCKRQTEPPGTASAPLEAAVSGCELVRSGPICEVGADRTIRLWVAGAPAPNRRLGTDRGPLAQADGRSVGDGMLYQIQVPPGADWLEVAESREGKPVSFRLLVR